MADPVVQDFDDFWRRVARAEEFVTSYGHVGYDPRDAEAWDEDFERAYDVIEPALQSVASTSIYPVPPGIPGFTAFSATTAHQALMFFLNPPKALFGSPKAIESEEYHDIKRAAQGELQRLGITKLPSSSTWPKDLTPTEKEILQAMREMHATPGEPKRGRPIADKAGYTYDATRRHLASLKKRGVIMHDVQRGYFLRDV